MFCKFCGQQVAPNAKNCAYCGASMEMNNGMNNQVMSQPMMNNNMMNNGMMQQSPMMNQPMMASQKNNKNSFVIILTVIVCLIAIVGTVIFVSGKDTNDSGEDIAVNTKTMEYNGFKYNIPNEYTSYIDSDRLYIESPKEWELALMISSGYYEQGNAAIISEGLKRNGYQVLNYGKKTYSGVEFMYFEILVNGYEKGLMAYAKASSNQIYAIVSVNSDNSTSHKSLEKIAPILKNAKTSSYTTSIKIDGTFSEINANEYFATE